MQLSKCKILLLLFCLPITSFAMFKDMDCINSQFESTVSHKGFPFGLSEDILNIKKNACVIEVEYQTMKFMKKKWTVDVCRGPVHIKYGTSSVEVIKKNDDDFGSMLEKIFTLVQDDGLIFAEGEKEVLNSDHGRVYCSYLLLKAYLESGSVFSRDNNYADYLKNWYQKGTTTTRVVKTASESVPSFKVEGLGVPVSPIERKGPEGGGRPTLDSNPADIGRF